MPLFKLPQPHKVSLGRYRHAVWRHWRWLVVSVAVAAIGGVQVIYTSFALPFWAWLAVAFVAFVVAQYRAFHDLRVTSDIEHTDLRGQVTDLARHVEQLTAQIEELRNPPRTVEIYKSTWERNTENWELTILNLGPTLREVLLNVVVPDLVTGFESLTGPGTIEPSDYELIPGRRSLSCIFRHDVLPGFNTTKPYRFKVSQPDGYSRVPFVYRFMNDDLGRWIYLDGYIEFTP